VDLFAFVTAENMAPIFVFVAMVCGVFWLLTTISNRNSQAEERLERIGRPKSLVEIEMSQAEIDGRFKGLKEAFSNLGGVMEPTSEGEKNTLRIKLANAGFRSENAASVYHGIRVVCLAAFLIPALLLFLLKDGFTVKSIQWTVAMAGLGFYLPQIVLWHLRTTRQKEIFLTLPDALDLMVVCVEAGLGLNAALHRVGREMELVEPNLSEELNVTNREIRAGKPRDEALRNLGDRTGVDDVKSLVAMLVQTDRFGTSIADSLRVFADSMRTKRRQRAEELVAKAAIKLIFPLLLFIFPALLIVLMGPALIRIYELFGAIGAQQ